MTKNCLCCGKKFTTNGHNVKYCGDGCMQLYARKRHIDRIIEKNKDLERRQKENSIAIIILIAVVIGLLIF